MKTNAKNIYESAKMSVKTNKALASACKELNKRFYTLSRLIKDLKLDTELKPYAEIMWKELGIEPLKSKGQLHDMLCSEQFAPKSKKDDTPTPCLFVRKLITKEVTVEGQTVHIAELDKNGQKQYRYEKAVIKDGRWTIDVLRDVILQRQAIIDAQA